MRRTSTILTAAMALTLLLGACVPQTILPEDCEAASVERSATLTATVLSPDAIAVCKGQQVSLRITVDVEGVVHLHGYDEMAPAQGVSAGETATFDFTASLAGQFVIEFHTQDDESEIGIFTVHER
jgi:hypothetical protein